MTEPRRRTVGEIAAPYGNYLHVVPSPAAGVCRVCRSGCGPDYPTCPSCGWELRGFEHRADAVAFVSLAPYPGQLARELLRYKEAARDLQFRAKLVQGLACVLYMWLGRHEQCVAREAGATGFDFTTTVPSSRGREGTHPLEVVVRDIVPGVAGRYRSLLAPSGFAMGEHEFREDRFVAAERLNGESVLIIDDTWTRGSHVHAAASALKRAGADRVAIVAIGRWYRPDDGWNVHVQEQRRGLAWMPDGWESCMFNSQPHAPALP